MLKLINRYYKILELESLSIYKKQARIPLKLTIEKIWCRRKRKTTDHFMKISVHAGMKSTKRGMNQQKIPKRHSCGEIKFGIQLETLPWLYNTRRLQLDTWNKKIFNAQKPRQLYLSKQWSKREAVASLLHLCLNNIWAPGQRHVCISKIWSFSYYSQATNAFQARAGPPRCRCFNRLN